MGSTLDIRDVSSILESGRSPGGGHGNPLQYSCLENPMDRGAWQPTFHSVTKSRTWLKQFSMDTHNRREANGLRKLNDTHAYCLSFDPPRSRPCNKSSSANSLFKRHKKKQRREEVSQKREVTSKGCLISPATTVGNWKWIPRGNFGKGVELVPLPQWGSWRVCTSTSQSG